eukprot:scaffold5808_cov128-Isochrysis_galbana.AAC.10
MRVSISCRRLASNSIFRLSTSVRGAADLGRAVTWPKVTMPGLANPTWATSMPNRSGLMALSRALPGLVRKLPPRLCSAVDVTRGAVSGDSPSHGDTSSPPAELAELIGEGIPIAEPSFTTTRSSPLERTGTWASLYHAATMVAVAAVVVMAAWVAVAALTLGFVLAAAARGAGGAVGPGGGPTSKEAGTTSGARRDAAASLGPFGGLGLCVLATSSRLSSLPDPSTTP